MTVIAIVALNLLASVLFAETYPCKEQEPVSMGDFSREPGLGTSPGLGAKPNPVAMGGPGSGDPKTDPKARDDGR